ncbi:MAG: glycosyltransferase family 2 protein [Bacteroidota bacterium]
MKKLTVIMPVYNGEKYLVEAVESVLNQTFTDFDLLVLNDNSSDSTSKILENFCKKDDRVIVVTKTSNEGPANLRNEGIEKAITPLIALLDADDIALPTRFEKQIQVLESDNELALCGTWFTIFGDKKEKIIKHAVEHDDLKVQFLHSCGLGNSTVMFKKSAIKDLRFEHEFVPAEDYGLWSEFIANSKFYNIPESLVRYRWHPGNISQTKEENLRIAEVAIKKRQLTRLGIDQNSEKAIYYVNAVCLKRKQSFEDIKQTITASNELLEKNKSIQFYNQNVLQKHIGRTILRTIRNAKKNNLSYFNYVKNESGYFSKIKFLDKTVLFFKCLF